MVWWAATLENDLSQGDLLEQVVFVSAARPLTPLEKGTGKGNSTIWLPSSALRAGNDGRAMLLAAGRHGLAIVLSHSCELDKEKERGRVLVAVVRPVSDLTDDDARRAVLAQEKRASMPVGEPPGLKSAHFVDLSTVATVDRRVVDSDYKRLASMNEDARKRLKIQLIAYFTRLDATNAKGIDGK